MKNIIVLLLSVSGLISCATPAPPPKPPQKYSVDIKFDNIMDENIVASDPRMQSIIGVARDAPGSLVLINCPKDDNNIHLAKRLYSIFLNNGVTVTKPACSKHTINKVIVKIDFLPNQIINESENTEDKK